MAAIVNCCYFWYLKLMSMSHPSPTHHPPCCSPSLKHGPKLSSKDYVIEVLFYVKNYPSYLYIVGSFKIFGVQWHYADT